MYKIKVDESYVVDFLNILKTNENVTRKIKRLFKSKVFRKVRIHDYLLGRKYDIDDFIGAFDQSNKNILFEDLEIEKIEDGLEKNFDHLDELYEIIHTRLSEFVDLKLIKNLKIYLYIWKYDMGFSFSAHRIYLNVYGIIKNNKIFNNILVHEVYHARKGNLFYYIKNRIILNRKTRLLSNVYSSIFEEGIATLIEKGAKDIYQEPKEDLEKLSHLLADIKNEKNYKMQKKKVSDLLQNELNMVYECGYYIANKIYLNCGSEGLDKWSKYYDWKSILHLYEKYK